MFSLINGQNLIDNRAGTRTRAIHQNNVLKEEMVHEVMEISDFPNRLQHQVQ